MSDEYVRVHGTVREVRDASVLFAVGDSVPRAGWIPRSLLHGADDRLLSPDKRGQRMTLRIMEWKADELGFTGKTVAGGGEHDLFEDNPDMR